MAEHELTPQEDARFDYLMDVLNKDANEAHEMLRRERQETIGVKAVSTLVEKPEVQSLEEKSTKHASRRGGRAYPEPSDSELDPYWNGSAPIDAPAETPESKAAFERLKLESREATIQNLVTTRGISEVAATALYKAKREVRSRDA